MKKRQSNIVKKLMAHPDYAKLVRQIQKDKRKKLLTEGK
tara:strand:+ start:2702 stop:2818 length:117 start_codon:yes stop_codon:yes gene_type:complete